MKRRQMPDHLDAFSCSSQGKSQAKVLVSASRIRFQSASHNFECQLVYCLRGKERGGGWRCKKRGGTAHNFLANLKLLNQKVFAHCDFNLQLAQDESKYVDINTPTCSTLLPLAPCPLPQPAQKMECRQSLARAAIMINTTTVRLCRVQADTVGPSERQGVSGRARCRW